MSDNDAKPDEVQQLEADALDEKLKEVMRKANEGESAAIAKLRQVEEALLGEALPEEGEV